MFKLFLCFVIIFIDMYEGRAYLSSSPANENAALSYFVDMCEGRAYMISTADFFDQWESSMGGHICPTLTHITRGWQFVLLNCVRLGHIWPRRSNLPHPHQNQRTNRFTELGITQSYMSTAIPCWKHQFKQHRAGLVLGWVTAWDYAVL